MSEQRNDATAAQDHAYAIRWALEVEPGDNPAAMDALEALLAEVECYQRGPTATSVVLRLELDMKCVRDWYDEYVAEVAFYVAEDNLNPHHPDRGYRTGEPIPFDRYAADVLTGVLDEVICAHSGYRVVRA